MRPDATNGPWRIFRWPLLIAAVTLAGLLSALIGDGAYDVLSWLLLAALLGVIAVLWRRAG
jgi:hypothetical protein